MLDRTGKNRHPCLIPDLRRIAFNFSPLNIMLAVGLSYTAFIKLRYIPSIPTLPTSLILWLLLRFFSLSLVLRNVIIMCHGIVFFISFALGIYWTCICWYTVLSNLEKISHYFFKYFLSISPLISKNPITCIFCHLKLSHSWLMLFLFALKCFSVFYFGYFPMSSSLQIIISEVHNSLLTCPMYFSSQIL